MADLSHDEARRVVEDAINDFYRQGALQQGHSLNEWVVAALEAADLLADPADKRDVNERTADSNCHVDRCGSLACPCFRDGLGANAQRLAASQRNEAALLREREELRALAAEMEWRLSWLDEHVPDQRRYCVVCSLRSPCDFQSMAEDTQALLTVLAGGHAAALVDPVEPPQQDEVPE